MRIRNRIRLCPFAASFFLFVVFASAQQSFNREVEKRIRERLDFFLGGPITTSQTIFNFRENGVFPKALDAEDRNLYLSIAYGFDQPLVYYAREDGTISGYYWSNGYYREPGNSGYDITDASMAKHVRSCVDRETGDVVECRLPPGASFISCGGDGDDVNGMCQDLELCPNQDECNDGDEECLSSRKWCRVYSIEQAPASVNGTELGYIPLTNHCHDMLGKFSQSPEVIIDPLGETRSDGRLTTCRFRDGSIVDRNLLGDYAFCGDTPCATTFVGGYESAEYDPRYRPWYIRTKQLQKPNWTPPFAFFSLAIGITYAHPIYENDAATGRNVFAGVLAIDYRFEDISRFLVDSYGDSTTAVVIFEDSDPFCLIGTSTGSESARFVLSSDTKEPCPKDRGDAVDCEPIRISVDGLSGNPMDDLLVKAAKAHMEAGYPDTVIGVKGSDAIDSDVYASVSAFYQQPGKELGWRVVILQPGAMNQTDYITKDDPILVIVCVVASFGVCVCVIFLCFIFVNRREKTIVYSDWRFTSFFIFGCMLMNGSSFTLLGSNTEVTCLLRMWSFHISFVIMLSPLFIKIWRINKLVGSMHFRRTAITNAQAILLTLPLIVIQAIILLTFTFVDRPVPVSSIETLGDSILQRITCETETDAFFIVEVIFETGLLLTGCVLAFRTRKLKDQFGESKQLMFSIYNFSFVALIVVIILKVVGLDGNDRFLLLAAGILWGTLCSAGAFVLPRLLELYEAKRNASLTGMTRNVKVSGLSTSNTGPRMLRVAVRELDPIDESGADDMQSGHESQGNDENRDATNSNAIRHPSVTRIQMTDAENTRLVISSISFNEGNDVESASTKEEKQNDT